MNTWDLGLKREGWYPVLKFWIISTDNYNQNTVQKSNVPLQKKLKIYILGKITFMWYKLLPFLWYVNSAGILKNQM